MRLLRIFTLLFICFSLFTGGVASAAMPCCIAKNASQIQAAKNKSDMPCHQKSKKESDSKTYNSCEKCRNCIATHVLISTHENYLVTSINVIHSDLLEASSSCDPDAIYSPPKHIS
jgi:hypothetical protein